MDKWIKTEKRSAQTYDNVEQVIELINEKIKGSYTAKIWYLFEGSSDEISEQVFKLYFSLPHIKDIQMVVECTDLYHTIDERIIKLHISDDQVKDIYEYLDAKGFIVTLDYYEVSF